MNPAELHAICHEAAQRCPQFNGYDDDQHFSGQRRLFGDIPKGGFPAVIRFWREEGHLFDMGYEAELPQHVRTLFDDIDKVINEAITRHFKS